MIFSKNYTANKFLQDHTNLRNLGNNFHVRHYRKVMKSSGDPIYVTFSIGLPYHQLHFQKKEKRHLYNYNNKKSDTFLKWKEYIVNFKLTYADK